MGDSARPGSPPAIRWIPRPPGRGIYGSRCAYSLGVCGWLAGGAVEGAAVPEWRVLSAAISSSDGAAPEELRRGSAALGSLAARRSSRVTFPLAGGRGTAAPAFVDLEGSFAFVQDRLVVCGARWRHSGAEERRPPDRLGSSPSPRFHGGVAVGHAGVACCFSETKRKPRRTSFVFLFVSGLFCKSLG